MSNIVGKVGMKLVTIAIGIPVGILAKKGVEQAWLAVRPDDPPRRAKDPNARLGDAIGWAALSAAGVAITQLLTRRWSARVWRALTGAEPPGTSTGEPGRPDSAGQPETAAAAS